MENINTPYRDKKRSSVDDALLKLRDWAVALNAADDFDEDWLNQLGQKVCKEYTIDKESRSEWEDTAEKALERVGMDRKSKNYPWPNAANVKFPLLLEACMQYNARSYPAIVPDNGPVKIRVVGDDPDGMKRARADRVGKYMSDQFLEEMEEWEEDTDALTMQQPVIGCVFRKVYPYNDKAVSQMVTAFDLVVNNSTKSLKTTPRINQRCEYYPHEIDEKIREGIFLELEYETSDGENHDEDRPQEFIEQHRYMDLDNDGLREPWIVTVHKDTEKVVRIEAGYEYDSIQFVQRNNKTKISRIPRKVQWIKYPFVPDPKGGFYDYGFGKITETLLETIDSSLNQMLDAGHLQTAGGGFIGSGLQLNKKGGEVRQLPGKYHTVKTSGSNIRDAVYNFDHKGPSPVLFQLLGLMLEAAKGLTSIKDVMTGEVQRNQPATTTLALIEQGMKVYTAIYKRTYRSLKQEFKAVFEINAKSVTEEEYLRYHDMEGVSAAEDFNLDNRDILPVADPNMVLDMQRASKAQLLLENARDPQLGQFHDIKAALMNVYEMLNVDAQGVLIDPQPDPMQQQMQQIAAAKESAEIEKTSSETEKNMAAAAKSAAEIEKMQAERDAEAFGSEFDAEIIPFQGIMDDMAQLEHDNAA